MELKLLTNVIIIIFVPIISAVLIGLYLLLGYYLSAILDIMKHYRNNSK